MVSKFRERRRWPRYAVEGAISLTLTSGGRTYDCPIEDISLGGTRLRFAGAPPPDPEFHIEHPAAGRFSGNRSWSGPDRLGVEFDHSEAPLDLIAYCLDMNPELEPGTP